MEEDCEETPEDEEAKVEWPTGVPQASDKELAKLAHTEGVRSHCSCWKPQNQNLVWVSVTAVQGRPKACAN